MQILCLKSRFSSKHIYFFPSHTLVANYSCPPCISFSSSLLTSITYVYYRMKDQHSQSSKIHLIRFSYYPIILVAVIRCCLLWLVLKYSYRQYNSQYSHQNNIFCPPNMHYFPVQHDTSLLTACKLLKSMCKSILSETFL